MKILVNGTAKRSILLRMRKANNKEIFQLEDCVRTQTWTNERNALTMDKTLNCAQMIENQCLYKWEVLLN